MKFVKLTVKLLQKAEKMGIKRRPRRWANQYIFFDVIRYNQFSTEINRRAVFICKRCRHLTKWDEDSKCYRCTSCGAQLTMKGALEIAHRYRQQLIELISKLDEEFDDANSN